MKKLIHEIHRRSLWQVLSIYVVSAWVALQVVDVLVDNFGLPAWFPAFALALLVIGLPLALATAFVQEGVGHREPIGEPAEQAAPAPAATTPDRLFTWRNVLLGGLGALALWGVLATGWLLFGPGQTSRGVEPAVAEAPASAKRSIAVLPFATRAAQGDEEAIIFSQGMHDDLLTQLAKIDSLTVISRTSVMRFAYTTQPMREIAAELGVATVLEGGVQRSGERVRVNVQLIDAKTDEHLWAESYDEELTAANIFQIQSDLAAKIAGALRTELRPEVAERIDAQPTESLEAYDLYARGKYLLSKGTTRADLEAAAAMFQRAIEADSSYALAWSGLAVARHELMLWQYMPEREALPLVRAAVDRALALDETLAGAHVARGALLRTERRYAEAEREFRRALELSPGSADAHVSYGELLRDLGRSGEAIEQSRRALELDPLSTRVRLRLAMALYFAGDWDGALAEAGNVLELEPDNAEAYYWRAFSHAWKGDFDQGIAALQRGIELEPDNPYYPPGLAFIYAQAGQRAKALEIVAGGAERGMPFVEIALVHGELGDLDRAFDLLDRALEKTPAALFYLNSDPAAAPLRSDPRWATLLERLKVE